MQAVFSSSETLHQVQREEIEAAFDCPMFDFYGHAERVVFATECEFHDGKVDAAEIEAAYQNSASLVRDVGVLDDRVRGMRGRLESHDTEVKGEFTAIKAELAALQAQLGQQATMLEAVLANQQVVLELLNTPQGQRPDWNQD